jgi:hypothetical protein
MKRLVYVDLGREHFSLKFDLNKLLAIQDLLGPRALLVTVVGIHTWLAQDLSR